MKPKSPKKRNKKLPVYKVVIDDNSGIDAITLTEESWLGKENNFISCGNPNLKEK